MLFHSLLEVAENSDQTFWLNGKWPSFATREIYSYFKKGCVKNVHATTPKGNMGYDQYTLFLTTVAVEPTFVAFH